jgi:hypothetical protein
MVILFRWFWLLTGGCVVVQWFYWAMLEAAYGMGNIPQPPSVDTGWLITAYVTAGFWMAERVYENYKRLMQ